jgi:hypothetical protein
MPILRARRMGKRMSPSTKKTVLLKLASGGTILQYLALPLHLSNLWVLKDVMPEKF